MLPFQPLFFCKSKEAFFHPPCPECGSILRQCYDDDLLVRLKLQPFSTSLRRYLYCPACLKSGKKSDFFVHEAETHDPNRVKNRWELVRRFGLLLENEKRASQFPCLQCRNKMKCYGPDDREVYRNIVCFSFYPFHLIVFEAMSLQAPDFLALLSGASFEELEASLLLRGEGERANCVKVLRQDRPATPLFLFAENERNFLEVFYLKLSFLAELIQLIASSSYLAKRPDLGLSLDQIWIKLADQGELLPSFWNFGVAPVALMARPLAAATFPPLLSSYGLYMLGLSWFHALLVNSQQNISQVHRYLGEALENYPTEDFAVLAGILSSDSHQTFAPENIYWKPEGKNVSRNLLHVWEKALRLGWSLLRAAYHLDPEWSEDVLLKQVEELRAEVKDKLFQTVERSVQPTDQIEREAIWSILNRIRHKWRSALLNADREQTHVAPRAPEVRLTDTIPSQFKEEHQEEAIDETLPLSSEQISRMARLGPEESEPATLRVRGQEALSHAALESPKGSLRDVECQDKEDMIPETVMLSPEQAAKIIAASVSAKRDKDLISKRREQDSSDITQLIKDISPDLIAEHEGENIPKTIVVSPKQARTETAGHSPTSSVKKLEKGSQEPSLSKGLLFEEDQLRDFKAKDNGETVPETVVVSPAGVPRQSDAKPFESEWKQVGSQGEEARHPKTRVEELLGDDFMVETVLLSPKKDEKKEEEEEGEDE